MSASMSIVNVSHSVSPGHPFSRSGHRAHSQSVSVAIMLAHCTFLTLIVIITSDSEFIEERESYIDTVQSQWKQYRNLVKDGFLYNDSFVVINDYDELISDARDSDIINDASIGDIPKLGFESTLMGMVTALQEIQSKGDQMMNAISDQKRVLVKLRSEVLTTLNDDTH